MSNYILGADYREVINGRVCVDGVLYRHPRLIEGETIKIWYGSTFLCAEPQDASDILDFLVLDRDGEEEAE